MMDQRPIADICLPILLAVVGTVFGLAIAFAAFCYFIVPADAKDILIVRGIFGDIVSPMNKIADGLRAKGNKVTIAEWFLLPTVKYDDVIGHSAGDAVLRLKAKHIYTIDPTFLNVGCPIGSRCINWYAPEDRLPFFICCGGYQVRGAHNHRVAAGHVSMPDRIAKRVIATVVRP